jgi:glyoxylase-like metal-dependent hydrolase (beta-lactamase superfamily II)
MKLLRTRSLVWPAWLASLLAVLMVIAVTACSTAPPSQAQRAQRVAEGVYVMLGTGGVADDKNQGRIGNSGFIVGDTGVLAIDTGTSFLHGQALLAAIRAVTPKPVRLALVTHTRPEFLFGGAAFQAAGIPVVMHRKTAQLMASRCDNCLKQLRQTLGDEAMRRTTMFKADRVFDDTQTIDNIGRPVQVLHLGHASGPGDIAVLDERSAVLFGGGLLDAGRIPDIQDSDNAGWPQALIRLQALQARVVVPGHGAVGDAAIITRVATYLTQLHGRARQLVDNGTSLLDVPEALDLPDYKSWDQYDIIHRRNAGIAYLRIERELLLK